MQTANQILRQMMQIEAQLADPADCKGRVTALKSAHRKLGRQYMAAIAKAEGR